MIQISQTLKRFFFSIFTLFTIVINGQELSIKTLSLNYEVKEDTSFVMNVSVLVNEQEEPSMFPVIYDTELESVSDIEVFEKKGKRFKNLDPGIDDQDIKLDYITSKKLKSIYIPPEKEIKISYKVKCDELMYLSSLPLFSNFEVDTLKYEVSVPESFHLVHNTIYADSLDFLTVDSIQQDGMTKYRIFTKPQKEEPDLLSLFGIYRNMESPLMRLIVVPDSYRGSERKYMNDWYLGELKASHGLDPKVEKKIDELTVGVTDPVEVIDLLYGYVRSHFKYVAIEIGMGAFIPSHINEVYKNKQGDCKDLSNFLVQALQYKGIESKLALAATHNHISDCDFPSLSSANHVICLAYIDDEVIALDPTDPIHQIRTPVQSLQNRTLLVFDADGGEFYPMETFSPEKNLIQYAIHLEENSDEQELKGTFKVDYKGISGYYLRWSFFNSDKEEISKMGLKHYESVFDQESISELSIKDKGPVISSEGHIKVNGKIFKDGDNRMLFIDFLPPLFEYENKEKLVEGTYIGAPFKKEVKMQINLDEAIESFQPIERSFTENGVSFIVKVTNPSESIVEYKYEFTFDSVFIDQNNHKITNEVLNSFKKLTDEPIIFRKKSS